MMVVVATRDVYGASAIKRRRRSRAELDAVDDAIIGLLADWSPMTVRQVYYRLVSLGMVPKDENGYRLVGRECLKLRRCGGIAYQDIADNTRWMRKPRTFQGLRAAMEDAIRGYRRSLWETQDTTIEVWCEKDALAGVIMEVTAPFDVPLMVSRGFSSESYLHESADYIRSQKKAAHIIILTDYDAAGLGIAEDVARKLPAFLPAFWPCQVERIAVTDAQIEDLGLLTREPKPRDIAVGMTRCVELDAIDPPTLMAMIESAITAHIDEDAWRRTQVLEERERASAPDILALFDTLTA